MPEIQNSQAKEMQIAYLSKQSEVWLLFSRGSDLKMFIYQIIHYKKRPTAIWIVILLNDYFDDIIKLIN